MDPEHEAPEPAGRLELGTATERAIMAQPEEIERLAEADLDEERLSRLGGCERVWLVGTGTSQHAAELGAAMLAEAGLDARPVSAMAFARFAPSPKNGDGVVLITHTAKTAYPLSARGMALSTGATLVSVTRVGSGWSEAVETVPKEGSQTYTLSYTATLVVLARIAALLGARTLDRGQIGLVGQRVREALEEPGTEAIAPPARALVFVGAGPASVTAREGALKAREAARLIAEGYDAEYLLHGSAVPLGADDHLVLLQPGEDADGLLSALGGVAEAEGIPTTTVEEDAPLHPLLAQVPLTVRLQLLALRLSRERAQDADVAITGAWAKDDLWAIGGP